MGIVSSCCTPRRHSADSASDREPLLSQTNTPGRIPSYSNNSLPQPRNQLDVLADIIAAVHAGKLPSQEQVNGALRRALASEILAPASWSTNGESHLPIYDQALADSWQTVVRNTRDACQAALEFGSEKNNDDRFQDLVYQLRSVTSVPLHADVAVEATKPGHVDMDALERAVPSPQEVQMDAAVLLRAVYILLYTLLTSAAFRLILADLLLIARETAADIAAHVEHVAGTVARVAENIEGSVRPGGGTDDDVKRTASEAGEVISGEIAGEGVVVDHLNDIQARLRDQTPEQIKQTMISRLQETIARAHRQPSFQAALRTILVLFRKYASKLRATVSVASTTEAPTIKLTPLLWADPPLARTLEDVKILFSRIAAGYSLDPLVDAFAAFATDILSAPLEAASESDSTHRTAMREWFSALGEWLDRALADPAYATSQAGKVRIDVLYDQARRTATEALADPEARWVDHLRTLLAELDAFVRHLRDDRTTQRLVGALSELAISLADAGLGTASAAPTKMAKAAQEARRDALRSFVLWLLPRVLRAASAIPMPRVEFVSITVEAAVDALLLTAPRSRGSESGAARREALGVQASLVPDRVRVESWNEVVVELDNTPHGSGHARSASSLMTLLAGTGSSPSGPGGANTTGQSRAETQMRTRVRAHVEGMRVSAHDVAYYVRYNGARCCSAPVPFTAYEDEGLISIDVGVPDFASSSETSSGAVGGAGGLSIDVELELESSSRPSPSQGWSLASFFMPSSGSSAITDSRKPEPLFRVTDVRADVPGLRIGVARSRHWLLNALLVQPLAAPLARAAARWVLAAQIRGALEAVAEFGGRVRARAWTRARARAETPDVAEDEDGAGDVEPQPSVEDWWDALAEEVGLTAKTDEDEDKDDDGSEDTDADVDEDGEADETAPLVKSHTRATVRGVVHTTVTQASPGAEPEESVLAVGLGAQVLPGKGGPYGSDGADGANVKVRAVEEAREAVADVARVEEDVEEGLREGVQRAVEVREEVVQAEAREQVRARVERRRRGWRSAAFDALGV